MRCQIAFGLTLSRVLETELEYGHLEKASEVTGKLRRLVDTVHRHLDEENHIPGNEMERVRGELVELEAKVLAIEERQQHRL